MAAGAAVFDPFYRVLGSGAAGSGLGLSIVRTTATRIGAQVSLRATGLTGRRVCRRRVRPVRRFFLAKTR